MAFEAGAGAAVAEGAKTAGEVAAVSAEAGTAVEAGTAATAATTAAETGLATTAVGEGSAAVAAETGLAETGAATTGAASTTTASGVTLKEGLQTAQAVSAVGGLVEAEQGRQQAKGLAGDAKAAAEKANAAALASKPTPTIDPDLTEIRKKNALLFGLEDTNITKGKAGVGDLGRATLLGG